MKMSNEIETFAGQWKICGDDTFFNGNLLVDRKNNYITLKIIKSGEEFFELYKQIQSISKTKVKYIQGKLFSGEYITLYKCISFNPHLKDNPNTSYMEFNIQVMYAFWGLNIEDNPHLKHEKIKINFGDNIINWYTLYYVHWDYKNNKNTLNIEVTKNNSIKLPYNEQLTIIFSPNIAHRISWNKREIPLKQDVSVIFEYQSETEWEKILDDILSIQYFIGLGTKQKIQIETIQYKHYILKIGEQYQDLYDDIILGTGEINTNIDNPKYLFNLQEFNQLNKDFSNWTKQYEKLKPILDLYFVIYTNIQIEIGFLLLMQALETFHARFVTDNKTDYINRIKNLLSKGINHELLYIDENKKHITLYERICDLCYANGSIPFPQNNYQELIKKLVRTRNYYTHYNEKRKEEGIFVIRELPNIIRFLKSLLEYHILTIIGFDDKFIKSKMRYIIQDLNFK